MSRLVLPWWLGRVNPRYAPRVAEDGEYRDDVTLAAACLTGDAAALATFDTGPLAAARDHLGALGFSPSAIDETVQRARHKLLVDGGLSAYRGRGPLATYVRTAVVRLAIDDQRKTRNDVELGEMLAAPSADPELEYMRKLYADHIVTAVRAAWQRLAPHEQFVLSLRIYEGMSIDDIARVYQSHRASAARRAAAARAAFIDHTRAALRERLSVGDTTLDSILRVVTTSVQIPFDEPLGA
jgi:RNA polymerase sigma-70 factor (ECF subfamily)